MVWNIPDQLHYRRASVLVPGLLFWFWLCVSDRNATEMGDPSQHWKCVVSACPATHSAFSSGQGIISPFGVDWPSVGRHLKLMLTLHFPPVPCPPNSYCDLLESSLSTTDSDGKSLLGGDMTVECGLSATQWNWTHVAWPQFDNSPGVMKRLH